ncbi:hypothetical protein [Bacillus sp. JJ1474]|uniref:hypothetical protein n=1 Tax=Bacillus sp. JJ1474 TaxID=3122955 RepID=UPI002FFEBBC8
MNKVANAIRGIGVLEIVAGIIIGFFLAEDYLFNWTTFLLWSGAGFVSGIMFIGFAEIIDLLHSINSKIKGTDVETNQVTDNIEVNSNSKSSVYNSIMKN